MDVSAPSRLITIHGEAHFNPDYILWLEARLAAYENLRAAASGEIRFPPADWRNSKTAAALAALDRLDQEKPCTCTCTRDGEGYTESTGCPQHDRLDQEKP